MSNDRATQRILEKINDLYPDGVLIEYADGATQIKGGSKIKSTHHLTIRPDVSQISRARALKLYAAILQVIPNCKRASFEEVEDMEFEYILNFEWS